MPVSTEATSVILLNNSSVTAAAFMGQALKGRHQACIYGVQSAIITMFVEPAAKEAAPGCCGCPGLHTPMLAQIQANQ